MILHRVIIGLIVLAGLINFAPVVGVLSGARVESLYGIELLDPTLEILLRHRAVLFGLVGGFMIVAAFKPHLHAAAIIGGSIAMVSFLALYFFTSTQPSSLISIVYADVVGLVALFMAMVLKQIKQRGSGLR